MKRFLLNFVFLVPLLFLSGILIVDGLLVFYELSKKVQEDKESSVSSIFQLPSKRRIFLIRFFHCCFS